MPKQHATDKLAIFVSPGSEVIEVITDKPGTLGEVYVIDGGPDTITAQVVADELRFLDLEERFQAAMDAAGCPDDDEDDD